MAEALLRHRLESRSVGAHVHSAGLLEAGRPASAHGVTVLQTMGLDLTGHRSRTMSGELLTSADLVLGMARLHVREAVVFVPSIWPRAFTLKELVRRGTEVGPRTTGQPFDEWLAKCHAGRTHADLLGDTLDDDVDDPIGTARANYERTAAELKDLVDRLVDLAFPSSPLEAGATP